MNVRCEQLDDLLLEGDRFSLGIAAQHAAACPGCMEKLTAWNEISETAASMRTTWPNEMLWPRIERALREEKRRDGSWRNWSVAAMLLLTMGLAAAGWFVMRSRDRDFDAVILRASVIDEVEAAERAHVKAIASLEKLAEAKLETDASPIMVSYKEKLMMLDDAIAECEAQIEHNRQNAHVRQQLLAMYSEKQRTLQDVLREDNSHETNQ
jgi:hypothetical protein